MPSTQAQVLLAQVDNANSYIELLEQTINPLHLLFILAHRFPQLCTNTTHCDWIGPLFVNLGPIVDVGALVFVFVFLHRSMFRISDTGVYCRNSTDWSRHVTKLV